jgi:hypothetical protein
MMMMMMFRQVHLHIPDDACGARTVGTIGGTKLDCGIEESSGGKWHMCEDWWGRGYRKGGEQREWEYY